MKRILFLLVVGCILWIHSAWGISLADGYKSGGIEIGSQAHTHLTTSPCLVYAIDVTPTVAGGFAQIIDTAGAMNDTATEGNGQVYVSKGIVKADIVGGTANATVHCEYPDGIPIGGQLFLDCSNATAEVYWKE